MEASDIKIIKLWLSTISATKNTTRNYTIALKFFCDLTGKTPNELLTEAESEVKAGVLMRERKIKLYLIDFKNSLLVHRFLIDDIISYNNPTRNLFFLF